jgi:hypothetical protein
MRKTFTLLLGVLGLIGIFLITSCTNSNQIQQDKDGNFILDVGVDSCNRNYTGPVNIKVYIDGNLSVNQRFQEAGVCLPSIEKFRFYLSKGTHEIRAESEGVAQLRESFEITNTKYASLLYSYPPSAQGYLQTGGIDDSGFYFNIQDEPIMYE